MAESKVPAPRPETPPPFPPARRSRLWTRWLLPALLMVAAYGGWRGWRWTSDTLDAMSAQQELRVRQNHELDRLRARIEELSTAVERGHSELAVLAGRLDQTLDGGRLRLRLDAVEQLLLLANDRLRLARDVGGARLALERADRHLAALKDPRLYRIRAALAQESAALAAVPVPDTAGTALVLAELLRQSPQFPLRTHVPERFDATAEPVSSRSRDAPWWQRMWSAFKTALSGLFTLRRSTDPVPRLLAPEQEALVIQVLQLKLEGARLALLAGDSTGLRELAAAARAWLQDYYDGSDPAVRAALMQLERMGQQDLTPELPDISRSLTLLRAALDVTPP